MANPMDLPGGFEMKGKITIEAAGRTFEVEIDGEEYFTADLRLAMRNGRDPAKALLYLADEGSKSSPREEPPGRLNKIGPRMQYIGR